MMGAACNEHDQGLIPRICKALFERIQSKAGSTTQQPAAASDSPSAKVSTTPTSYRIEVSYLEIYNEKVRDLQGSQSTPKSRMPKDTSEAAQQQNLQNHKRLLDKYSSRPRPSMSHGTWTTSSTRWRAGPAPSPPTSPTTPPSMTTTSTPLSYSRTRAAKRSSIITTRQQPHNKRSNAITTSRLTTSCSTFDADTEVSLLV